MGIDVEFKARPFKEIGAQRFDAIRARLHEEFLDDYAGPHYRFPDMEWDQCEPEPTIRISCTDRYYGIGYERGHWPQIKRLGDWLAVEFGELAELRYGGDHADEWGYLQRWGEVRDELQRRWDEHGNEPYRAQFR